MSNEYKFNSIKSTKDMTVRSTDISLMKDLVKQMESTIRMVEKKAASCETQGIISDFISISQDIKKNGPEIVGMRVEEPENKEILETAQKFASLNVRYLDAMLNFENDCRCKHKYEEL